MMHGSRHDALILFGSLALLFGMALPAGPLAAQQPTVRTVTLESTELDQTREIMIFEPLNYARDEFAYYDVLYVFDAQTRMFFDYASSIANLLDGGQRGFIVVGIRATSILDELYGRNHDLLPSDTDVNLGPKSGGNAEKFLAYVRNEVVPYVESNYRVLPHRTAIGHSLSASFLVWTMLNETELFDNYIAVDPNLAFDDQRLVRGLRAFDSEQFETPVLFYMSHADANRYVPSWRAANYEANLLLLDTLANDHFQVQIEQYPDETHMSSFVPSVNSAMRTYLQEIRPEQVRDLSEEQYEVTFRVHVPDPDADIWISGNQESLGGWGPDRLKLERVSPLVREITVSVRDHVELRLFGGGEGDSPAWIVMGEPGPWGVPRTNRRRMIRPEDGAVYEFEVQRTPN
ncbi:MAG: alpha/beta hydrolase-fold protein [Longimicrobiales bacterium]|nr:alpha/beta hydrolase-fold protein [Longimicrobiales bacterium]